MVDPYRPTDDWREGYDDGYSTGYREGFLAAEKQLSGYGVAKRRRASGNPHPKKRKLSAWNKYVKANSKKPRFIFRSGKLNLKKMGVAFRKTPAGRKKK